MSTTPNASLGVSSSSQSSAGQSISTGSTIGGNQLNLGSGTITSGVTTMPSWIYICIAIVVIIIIFFMVR